MALDATPPAYRRLRLSTQRNIGLAFVRSGRFQEACDAFSAIMQARREAIGVARGGCICSPHQRCMQSCIQAPPCSPARCLLCRCPTASLPSEKPCTVMVPQDGPDHQTAYNLVLCAAALGDAELMRHSFVQLLQVGRGARGACCQARACLPAARLHSCISAYELGAWVVGASLRLSTQVPPYADDSLAGESSDEEGGPTGGGAGKGQDALQSELQAMQVRGVSSRLLTGQAAGGCVIGSFPPPCTNVRALHALNQICHPHPARRRRWMATS